MPQMAPLSWLVLFILFSLPFMFSAMLNYFALAPTPQSSTSSDLKNAATSYNWQW